MEATAAKRPLSIRIGRRIRRNVDRLIVRSSRVGDPPVFDDAAFAWTANLRRAWPEIRAEALAVMRKPKLIPELATISPDHDDIAGSGAEGGEWRSFFLHGYGIAADDNLARCPRTAAAVARVPGLNTAFFSILTPGLHIPAHRGVTKGLLTCHLGLDVPDGPCRMLVGDRFVRWAEGQTLVFDDTRTHEVWNDTDRTRIVLLIQFERPLRQPGRAIAGLFLWLVRHSAFVKEARDNFASWEAAVKRLEAAAQDDEAEIAA